MIKNIYQKKEIASIKKSEECERYSPVKIFKTSYFAYFYSILFFICARFVQIFQKKFLIFTIPLLFTTNYTVLCDNGGNLNFLSFVTVSFVNESNDFINMVLLNDKNFKVNPQKTAQDNQETNKEQVFNETLSESESSLEASSEDSENNEDISSVKTETIPAKNKLENSECKNVLIESYYIIQDKDDEVHIKCIESEKLPVSDDVLTQNIPTVHDLEIAKNVNNNEKSDSIVEPNLLESDKIIFRDTNFKKMFFYSDWLRSRKTKEYQRECFYGFKKSEREEVWDFLLKIDKLDTSKIVHTKEHKEKQNIKKDFKRLGEKIGYASEVTKEKEGSVRSNVKYILYELNSAQPELGYYQGLDNIVIELYIHYKDTTKDQNNRFKVCAALLDKIYVNFIKNNFCNFPKFCEKTKDILEQFRPDLLEKFDFCNFQNMILLEYYLTLFCRLNSKVTVRFLDVFCAYGIDSLHYFALGILDYFEDEILRFSSEDLGCSDIIFFKNLRENRINEENIDAIMKRVEFYLYHHGNKPYTLGRIYDRVLRFLS